MQVGCKCVLGNHMFTFVQNSAADCTSYLPAEESTTIGGLILCATVSHCGRGRDERMVFMVKSFPGFVIR